MKLTADDFEQGRHRELETPPQFNTNRRFKDEPDMYLTITPSSQQFATPGGKSSVTSPPPLPKQRDPYSRHEIQNQAAAF